uniref:Nuclear apoptosis inducing factor 1 n=1 Tax=Cyprinus carpio TaxID=7962 RepID=A0A8C2K8S8_CYPCA
TPPLPEQPDVGPRTCSLIGRRPVGAGLRVEPLQKGRDFNEAFITCHLNKGAAEVPQVAEDSSVERVLLRVAVLEVQDALAGHELPGGAVHRGQVQVNAQQEQHDHRKHSRHGKRPEQESVLSEPLLPGIQSAAAAACEIKTLEAETTYHTLEEGMVEYCTAETPVTVTAEAPVEMLAQAECKPQELKSRIALNSAKLLQEHRVTNLHVREIAQHLENQNDLLQMIRRSQEAQACAQERQAQALEGTQAALLALIQIFRPALKDLRKFLQNANSANTAPPAAAETGEGAENIPPQTEDA